MGGAWLCPSLTLPMLQAPSASSLRPSVRPWTHSPPPHLPGPSRVPGGLHLRPFCLAENPYTPRTRTRLLTRLQTRCTGFPSDVQRAHFLMEGVWEEGARKTKYCLHNRDILHTCHHPSQKGYLQLILNIQMKYFTIGCNKLQRKS